MRTASALQRLERIVDQAAVAPRIEALLPMGVGPRQLRVRTLLLGMLLTALDGRPRTSDGCTRRSPGCPRKRSDDSG